jgi:aconitate hydratase
MPSNLATKLIESHLADGDSVAGEPIALRFDQTLTQDATGTLAMLTLEAMKLDRVRTEVSAQYVDHNLIQADNRNADDHLFLLSACRRFGVWYSGPGNGVSHPLHMQRFGKPGKTLIGSDSHTPAAGALGMLAVGAGGADVALAMAGEPVYLRMPEIWGVRLSGTLPDWVSAKDVVLEMLRRHGVDGGRGRIIEYYGPGVANLSAMDRHVIANMGTELGATTTVFPSDDEIRRYLESEDRGADWVPLAADPDCSYHHQDEIDLRSLEPLIAKPSSPGNVVPVAELAGEPIYQAYIGSSANPGYRDFAVAAEIVRGRVVAPGVSFDVNPTSRQLLGMLIRDSRLGALVSAGARLHQAGCNGCIGMGQAPAVDRNSLRTVPRNFPGRSGTREDRVFLCSPETATASALTGCITDPRKLDMAYPHIDPPEPLVDTRLLLAPVPADEAGSIALVKGPNITELPELESLPERLCLPVLLKVADDLSTDEILPAGARVLPYRSNIGQIARFSFEAAMDGYADRADALLESHGGHAVVGGRNYGQGSSREHAALAPRVIGLRAVIAKTFARIHAQNLTNYGVLALSFVNVADYDALEPGDEIVLDDLHAALGSGARLSAHVGNRNMELEHGLSPREAAIVTSGGIVNWRRARGSGNP